MTSDLATYGTGRIGPRLKVAMISYYLPSESKIGVGHQAHALANAMVDRGHEVTVFTACAESDGARYTTRTLPLSGANRTFKFALHLRHLDWSRFDVLHAHGDDYWLWRRRVPAHVRTMHGSCFSEALHIRGARERIRMILLGFSEWLATGVADVTVAVSRNTRRQMPWVRMIIPNGVDLSRFHPGQQTTTPVVLFVGTYLRRKRGKFLMEAFERHVLPQLPDAKLWMVAEDAPSRPWARIFSRISDQELAELYRRAWVFSLPSTYEGFGIPYVEAMASGCPVVASPNPGAIEVTDNGRVGLLANDDELGPALLRMLTSRADRDRLSTIGLEHAARYSLTVVAETYERLYLRLLEGSR